MAIEDIDGDLERLCNVLHVRCVEVALRAPEVQRDMVVDD